MIGDKIKLAESETNTNPTVRQKEAGNYKKGKVTIMSFNITIENPIGSTRSGVDSNGNEWSCIMKHTYGYFNGTVGKDGDQIDVFLGDYLESDFDVYIVDQIDADTKAFDEHKVMFGFRDINEAKEAYLESYSKGWEGFGNITTLSLSKFKEWIKNKDAIKYPAKKLNMSSKIDFKNSNKGERIRVIRLLGEVIDGKTLANLKGQAGDIESFDKLILEIASPGGSVSEGLEIMVWLDSLSSSGKQIISVVVANAYSIASLIMLAADVRLISIHGKVMVHNPMVPELQYVNANDLEKYVDSLRELEAYMYELYKLFTGLKEEQIKALMDKETYLSPKEAVEYGFAQMVVDIKPKPFEMATNLKREINMHKTLNVLTRVISMVNQSDFINQLYSDEMGNEIEIFQSDPSTYKVGDRTSVESSGEDGIKLSDGARLTIEDFIITDIDRSTEVTPEGAEVKENENLEVEPELVVGEFNEGSSPNLDDEPKVDVEKVPTKSKDEMPGKVIETTELSKTTKETVATQITSISKWEAEVVNDTFELETKVEYVPIDEDGEPYSVGAGEWQLDDGRTALTDSEGIIRYIKEAPMENKVDEDISNEYVENSVKEDDTLSKDIEIKSLKEEMKAMREEMENISNVTESKFKEVAKFEQVAAKAIDTIASNTSSSFKPNAISSAIESPTGSIFKRAMKKAGH